MGKEYLSIEVGPAANDHEGAPRRNYKAYKEAWSTPRGKPHVRTIYDLFKDGCKEFASWPALGQRKFIKTHTETKDITKKVNGEEVKSTKEWQFFEMGPYDFVSYSELETLVLKLGSGLLKLGLRPGQDRFSIYSRTSSEWMETALACASQSLTIATAYDTLGVEGLRSSLQETGCKAILTDKENFGTLLKALPDCKNVKTVIYRETDGPLSDKEEEQIKTLEDKYSLHVIPFSHVLKLGEESPSKPHPPKPEDVACIMYTSGSTGKPKGVVLTNANVIAGVTGATGNITRDILGPGDQFLSILPLAHILEFTAELCTFYWGTALGYGTPKTVSDTNMRNCKGDIRELRPTIMCAVPALWETVRKGILAKVEKSPAIAQRLFWAGFHLKAKMASWGLPAPGVDSLIFSKIKDATGGRLRYVMNGGAGLPRGTRVFLETCIAPCLMGYGLTETNAMGTLMSPQHFDLDSTGELVPSVTVKLVDVPDAGYFAKNGQGELFIKGPCVSSGYFQNQEETSKAYTKDGYFMTGDIAEWSKTGAIRLIDRKKNLVKTLNGEYIALERLESLYRGNKYVANLCVFADEKHAKPVAVIVPNEPAVKDLCEKLGVEFHEGVANTDKQVHKTIAESLVETAHSCDLKPVEHFSGITFSEEEWTPQNGFVTSAQKIQRRKVKEANEKGIKRAYEGN